MRPARSRIEAQESIGAILLTNSLGTMERRKPTGIRLGAASSKYRAMSTSALRIVRICCFAAESGNSLRTLEAISSIRSATDRSAELDEGDKTTFFLLPLAGRILRLVTGWLFPVHRTEETKAVLDFRHCLTRPPAPGWISFAARASFLAATRRLGGIRQGRRRCKTSRLQPVGKLERINAPAPPSLLCGEAVLSDQTIEGLQMAAHVFARRFGREITGASERAEVGRDAIRRTPRREL